MSNVGAALRGLTHPAVRASRAAANDVTPLAEEDVPRPKERKSILKRLSYVVRKPGSKVPIVSFEPPPSPHGGLQAAGSERPGGPPTGLQGFGAAQQQRFGLGGPDYSPTEFTPRSVNGAYVTQVPLIGCCATPRSGTCNTGSTCSSPGSSPVDPRFWGAPEPACAALGASGAAAQGPRVREVFMLYASPLYQEAIDFRSEAEAVGQALSESGSDALLKVGVASAGSLTKLFALARSRRGLVLHLSAHAVQHQEKGVGLVLEDGSGGPHVLWRAKLEEFLSTSGGLQHISLLVLSTCHSEELAQVFIEHGCKHVVATREKVHDTTARRFAQQFYYELAVNNNLLKAWEGAMQALSIDPDETTASEADLFTFYGQRGADRATLETLCGTEVSAHASIGSGLPARDFADVATFLDLRLPSRPELCLGRGPLLHALARTFQGPKGRRAVVMHGPKGIGKSAFGLEFAHLMSAPGRLFSCAPLLLRVCHRDLDAVIGSLEDQVDNLMVHLGEQQRRTGASGGREWGLLGLSRSSSAGSSRSDRSCSDLPDFEDLLSIQVLARQRILKSLQQLEKGHRLAKALLVVDDEVGYLKDSSDVRWLLGELLEHTNHLHILILSREPIYEPLGSMKLVNQALGGLDEMDAARLFLNRIHRPLEPRDLGNAVGPDSDALGAAGYRALPQSRPPSLMERTSLQLRGHPLMQRLAGHPGHICMVSTRVTPGGPSLYDLAASEDLLHTPDSPPAPSMLRQRSMPPGGRPLLVDRPLRPYSASPLELHEPEMVDLR